MWFEDNMGFGAPQEKKVKIYLNGDSSISCEYNLKANKSIDDIKRDIIDRLRINPCKKMRFFTSNGVEIFAEDFLYIKNGDILYVSRGEDYDQNSSFSEYEILKELGVGGFGKVVLGVHRATKEKVAIKFINASAMASASDIDMVFKEANMLKALNHKNIVKIFNVLTLSDSQVVFVMEYLEGGELFDYVSARSHLTENEAQIFFRQLADAVHYCHQENLIHRDLKLENVLLMDKAAKVVKIVDFGIAGLDNASNSLEAGSVRYMPPECFTGKSKKSHPSVDVWALGCILFGMLFGDLPFNGSNNHDIIEKIIEGKWKIPEKFKNMISNDCIDLLKKLLTVNHEERATMVDVVNHPWVNPYYQKPMVDESLKTIKEETKTGITTKKKVLIQIPKAEESINTKSDRTLESSNKDKSKEVSSKAYSFKDKKPLSTSLTAATIKKQQTLYEKRDTAIIADHKIIKKPMKLDLPPVQASLSSTRTSACSPTITLNSPKKSMSLYTPTRSSSIKDYASPKLTKFNKIKFFFG